MYDDDYDGDNYENDDFENDGISDDYNFTVPALSVRLVFPYCGFCSNRILHYFPMSVCVLVCHRRDISSFLDNLILQTMQTVCIDKLDHQDHPDHLDHLDLQTNLTD